MTRPTATEQLQRLAVRVLQGDGLTEDERRVAAGAISSFARSETQRTVAPNVDGEDFYELCQTYRHSRELMPNGLPNTVQAFNELREYIKTGRLPWPSYEPPHGRTVGLQREEPK